MSHRRPLSVRRPAAIVLLVTAGAVAAALALTGCDDDSRPEATLATTPVAPITSRGERPGGPAAGGTPATPGAAGQTIRWTVPAGWTQTPPSSAMRMAEMTIPGAGGEAQLAVFYFGAGQGGEVGANLDRWAGQVDFGGKPPERGELDTESGYHVSWIDVAGTLQPSMMGAGPATPQPDSRLLGAVVEGPGGPWFFKATGPASTLAAARGDFLALLRSIEPAAATA